MGRIVAIAGGDLQSTYAINKYIVDMDEKKLHNFLFIGTASKDAQEYIDNIKRTFEPLNCNVGELCLVAKEYTQNEIDELLAWADIIYVGGGDTFFMMEVWRKYGLDRKLEIQAYTKDKIPAMISLAFRKIGNSLFATSRPNFVTEHFSYSFTASS